MNENKCPLCGCTNLIKIDQFSKEKYYLFMLKDKWICSNCGCFFSDKDAGNKFTLVATKISKKKFFHIIFSAIHEICSDKKLSRAEKRKIINVYENHMKIHYKEVANMYVNLFYETDCIQKENWILGRLYSMSKQYLKI